MRRVRYYEFGGPDVLRVEKTEVPVPGAGQVLIAAEAIGTSYVDTAMRRGISPLGQPTLPGSPHGDVVGTVEATGGDVGAAVVGQRVVALVAASSPGKLEFARQHGADVGICYADADWAEQVRAAAPDGVDVILDSVGGQVTATSMELLAPFGSLRAAVQATFPLEEAAQAHALLEDRSRLGRVLLVP